MINKFFLILLMLGTYIIGYSEDIQLPYQQNNLPIENNNYAGEPANPATDKMKQAYEFSNILVRDRLQQEDEAHSVILEEIGESDLVVVKGTYDHIHLVLENLELPFVQINPNQVVKANLQPHQTVFVNCMSGFPVESAKKLARFVEAGGQLITTDWALKYVLEVAFPGMVKYNNRPTGDEVVSVSVLDKEDFVIKGFLDEEVEPVWWLEGSSYPIQILDKEKVKILIKSDELKRRYGEEAVIVRFEYGKGVVYHMISHFYLQRTETRNAKQSMAPSDYSKSKGASPQVQEIWEKKADAVEDLNYGDVQSSNTSSEFVLRAIINQKKRIETIEEENQKQDKSPNSSD